MPHFGLMDESAMPREAAALLRARLHLRGGRRRLRQAKDAAAVAALYDALCSGMRWYVLMAKEAALRPIKAEIDLRPDCDLFSALAQAGVLDEGEAFEQLETLLDLLLNGMAPEFDPQRVLADIEHWLTQLGVMPFDESELPPEDPNTY